MGIKDRFGLKGGRKGFNTAGSFFILLYMQEEHVSQYNLNYISMYLPFNFHQKMDHFMV